MHRPLVSSIVLLIVLCATAAAGPLRVSFQGETSEHKWALQQLARDLPADWSGYEYLVLEMRASSPQRFYLRIHTAGGVARVRLHLFGQGAWSRVSIPLKYFQRPDREGFDLASLGNKPRNSFWMGVGGPHAPLKAVQALSVLMQRPVGKPRLEIRSVRLSRDDPGSEILVPKPVIDEFGQWLPGNWPGKIKSLAQLQKEWAREESSLHSGDFNYCTYGGYLGTQAKATGFFRVEQVDGKWWFVDPDGHLFFSVSPNGMRGGGGDSRLEERKGYYAALPPAANIPAAATPGRAAGAGGRGGGIDTGRRLGFSGWNLLRRFGPEWNTRWVDFAVRRMEDWGLNTVGNWSNPRLWDTHKKAYMVFLRGWGLETGYMGMPDVYSTDFSRIADKVAAEQCGRRKDDPWLLGYFIGNEPPWPGRESLVVDTILERPPSAIQREAKAFLAAGDTPARRKEFVYRAFDRFLEVVNAAVRKHDPNHLNLGLRFGGEVPAPEIVRASRTFDVYSLNVYDYAIKPEVLSKIYEQTGRPILIGEFHNGTPGRGLAAGLVQVSNLKERGVAYRYYVEQAASFPAFVGASWFTWSDEPVLGRMDGENYNIGLVDVMDRPYRDLIDAMKETHRRLFAVHSGKEAPFRRKATVQ